MLTQDYLTIHKQGIDIQNLRFLLNITRGNLK
jgi:hypothetical protein